MAFIIYGDTQLPLTPGMTPSAAKEQLSAFFPELRSSEAYTDGDGDIRFRIVGGSKGMAFIVYGDTQIPLTPGMTPSAAKEQLSAFFPELRSSEAYTDNDGDIRFRIVGGSKGV